METDFPKSSVNVNDDQLTNNNKYLQGKIALVTGSSRGIGRGIAIRLAEMGATVAVNYYKNEAAANDTLAKIRECGSDGFIVQADVSRSEDIANMIRQVKDNFGAL